MKTFLGLDKQDWVGVVGHIVPAIVAAVVIAFLGSRIHASWLVIPITPLLTGGGYFLATKNMDKKSRKDAVIRATLFGLVFGLAGYIFS